MKFLELRHIESFNLVEDGGWSSWERYCVDHLIVRRRKCNQPIPQNGGKQCEGEDFELHPVHDSQYVTKTCKSKYDLHVHFSIWWHSHNARQEALLYTFGI